MRNLILILVAIAIVAIVAIKTDTRPAVAASGDVTSAVLATYSGSGQTSCVRGSLRHSKNRLQFCYSSGAGKWR